MILEGSYKSKLQDSVQLQTLVAMYEQMNIRKQRTTEPFQIEDFSKTSCSSDKEDGETSEPGTKWWKEEP